MQMNGRSLMAALFMAGAVVASPTAWAQTAIPPAPTPPAPNERVPVPPERSTDIPEEQGTMPGTRGTRSVDIDSLSDKELRNKAVYDQKDRKVATIRDVTGTPGHSRQAVLDTSGGVMGLAQKEVTVPLDRMSVDPDGRLVLDMTADELKDLPRTR